MWKRSGRFLCSQNINWKLPNKSREHTVKRLSGDCFSLSFLSFFLLSFLHFLSSFHMSTKRTLRKLCLYMGFVKEIEIVLFRILRIDWCFRYIFRIIFRFASDWLVMKWMFFLWIVTLSSCLYFRNDPQEQLCFLGKSQVLWRFYVVSP